MLKSSSFNDDNAWMSTPKLGQTALGSTQGTAYVIPLGQDFTVFTTVAVGTGAILPAQQGISPSEEYMCANHGANALLVYPPVGGTIGNAAANTAYSLPAGKTGYFRFVGNNAWTACP